MSIQADGVSWVAKLFVVFVAVLFCAAPVPGDVGGCGQKVQELDAPRFFSAKKFTDCEHCEECGLSSALCEESCDERVPSDTEFPDRCLPLVHDGEVCLRKLVNDGCDDYAEYMSAEAPRVPTECNFCPPLDP